LNICQIRTHDVADGPGVRVAVYVSGCEFYCPECHNKEAWDFNYGEKYSLSSETKIMDAICKEHISGLSILGGEPLHPRNVEMVLDICRLIRLKFYREDRSIWIWTGYTAEELLALLSENDTKHRLTLSDHVRALHEILYLADVIVEGRYEKDKKDLRLKFRGSTNQRIIKSRELLDKKIVIIPDDEI